VAERPALGSAETATTLTAAVARGGGTPSGRAGEEQRAGRLADAELPGVGDEAMTLRQGCSGGVRVFAVLLAIVALDELSSAALGVLAPTSEIPSASAAAIVFISGSAGSFIVLGALPMGWLADRFRRGRSSVGRRCVLAHGVPHRPRA
jgi:hypothetical protein